MLTDAELQEYLDEIRTEVCSRCIERLPGGPPCGPLGKACAVERHLGRYVEAIHEVESSQIEPYLENLHLRVCSGCERRGCDTCPCPLDYLLPLVVQAVETVDRRRLAGQLIPG